MSTISEFPSCCGARVMGGVAGTPITTLRKQISDAKAQGATMFIATVTNAQAAKNLKTLGFRKAGGSHSRSSRNNIALYVLETVPPSPTALNIGHAGITHLV